MLVRCPHCRTNLNIDTHAVEPTIHCSVCGGFFSVNRPRLGSLVHTQTKQDNSGYAAAALIFGCLTFFFYLVAFIPAMAFAILAFREINASDGKSSGRNLAIAGLITGIVGCLLWSAVLGSIYYAVISADQNEADTAAELAARQARSAQEAYYYQHCSDQLTDEKQSDDNTCRYALTFEELLSVDPELAQEKDITFRFASPGNSGFVITATHADGSGEEFTVRNDPTVHWK